MTKLTIQAIKVRAVVTPMPRPITTATISLDRAPLLLIDLKTHQGIEARAYLFTYTALALRPLALLIENIAHELMDKAIEPIALMNELEAKFRLLGRQGLMAMALAGLDMIFYDALARAQDLPVAKLLGGSTAPIPCYDSHGIFEPGRDDHLMQTSLQQGFKAIKIKLGAGSLNKDIQSIQALRDIIGPDIRLMVDYNQSLQTPEAIKRILRLEAQFDLDWIEEPVLAEDYAGHIAIRSKVRTAIQTGENWNMAEDAARAIQAGISDHVMLDIMKIGGITGWQRAAAMAKTASLPVSSHLFVEASAHVMAVTQNAYLLEYLDIAGLILKDPLELVDGTIAPQGPGLGINWDETEVAKYIA